MSQPQVRTSSYNPGRFECTIVFKTDKSCLCHESWLLPHVHGCMLDLAYLLESVAQCCHLSVRRAV